MNPISPENYSMLRTALFGVVRDRATHVIPAIKDDTGNIISSKQVNMLLTPTQQERLVESLLNFVTHASSKFIKGQVEHGSELSKRDLKHERLNEIVDLYFYNDYDSSDNKS